MKANLQEQLVNDLLIESFEGLDSFDRDLLVLETGTTSPEILNRIFRVIHTIKGTAGCLGYQKIEKVAHVGENLLSLLRENQLAVSGEIVSSLLTYADALREMLHCLEANRTEGDKDYSGLLARLVALQTPGNAPAPSPKNPAGAVAPPPVAKPGSPAPAKPPVVEPPPALPAAKPAPEGWGLFDDPPAEPSPAPKAEVAGNGWGLFGDEAHAPAEKAAPTPAASGPPVPPPAAPPAGDGAARGSIAETAIRVDVGQLDRLMNLVGELVLARNQITQHISASRDSGLLAVAQRLNHITSELQEGVMKTRMQPIDNVVSRFPRIVRDVAQELGKQVRLELAGRDTELDRTIIESIKDPLTHVVRNSIDHGIESPEKRVAAGKPATGLLFIRAYHEGGQVNIEISDDGAGINVARVKQKSLDKGLITPEQAARMSDREAAGLIFLPGLSTAEKVTNVSGRGVGMDVVKTNIERVGGSVDIQTEPGQGTTIKFKIPLTLAIIPALIVSAGGERFAIPQVNLLELVRVETHAAEGGIERIFDAPVYRLRGKLLPLVYLKRTLAGDSGQHSHGPACGHHHQGDTGEVFLKARDAHRAWLGRLREVLDGRKAMTVEEAGSHRLCLLGKWIYSEGLKDYGDIAEVHALEKVHERFHNLVREIVQLRNANELAKAEERLAELTALSQKVLDYLMAAEKRVLESQSVNIVVLQADGRQFGLVVDAVNDTQEIVVKPLGKQLKGITIFAGATIMGDGQVALILDVLGLAQHAAVLAENRAQTVSAKDQQADSRSHGARQTLLVFAAGENSRFAMPLSQAARLEEFPRPQIERCGARQVVQYRGSILPLIDVAEQLGRGQVDPAGAAPLQVVVYAENGRSVGLVVGEIIDIVEEAVAAERHGQSRGVLGSALVSGRVTDLLDVREVIAGAAPAFFAEAA